MRGIVTQVRVIESLDDTIKILFQPRGELSRERSRPASQTNRFIDLDDRIANSCSHIARPMAGDGRTLRYGVRSRLHTRSVDVRHRGLVVPDPSHHSRHRRVGGVREAQESHCGDTIGLFVRAATLVPRFHLGGEYTMVRPKRRTGFVQTVTI